MPTISRHRLVLRELHANSMNSMNMRAHRPTGAALRSDAPASVRSLGLASDRLPSRTFQGTPTRHRGRRIGNIHLVEKEGGRSSRARNRSHHRRHPPWNRGWCTVAQRTTLRNNALHNALHKAPAQGLRRSEPWESLRRQAIMPRGEIGIWCGLLPTRHRVSATRSGPFHAG